MVINYFNGNGLTLQMEAPINTINKEVIFPVKIEKPYVVTKDSKKINILFIDSTLEKFNI